MGPTSFNPVTLATRLNQSAQRPRGFKIQGLMASQEFLGGGGHLS